ncbi:MAG TPA: hypothetical protein VHP36_09965, partial [Chitinispirillaceae bacterium]|nr:hypothetical protein [Chitinispirillaceae bacterium]
RFSVHIITDSINISPLQKIHLSAKVNPAATNIRNWEWSINSAPFKSTSTVDTFIIAPINTGKFTCILRGTNSDSQSASDTLNFNIQSSDLQVYAQGKTEAGLFERITLSAQTNSNKPVLSLSWDIGNTGKFVPTASGSITIGPFRVPQKKIECIVRAIDESGLSAFDTISLKVDYLWEELLPVPELSERKSHILIPFNNSLWIIGGSRNDLWYSVDGKTWNLKIETTPLGPRYGHVSIIYDEKLWVIGGKIGSDSLPGDIWNTSDGSNWHKITQSPFLKRYYHSATVFQNRIYIIGGLNDSADAPCLNDIWLSENGIKWTKQNTISGFLPRYGHGAIVFNNSFFLIGGHYDDFSGSKTVNDIWESKNGTNWQKVNDNLSFPDNHFLSYLVYDQRIWAIGGFLKSTPSSFSNIWMSNDGMHWIRQSYRGQDSEGFHLTGTVFNNKIIMSPSGSNHLFSLK